MKHYKMLIEGETVILDDGTVVTPQMVMSQSKPAQDFINVNLPGKDYVPSFLENNTDLIEKFV